MNKYIFGGALTVVLANASPLVAQETTSFDALVQKIAHNAPQLQMQSLEMKADLEDVKDANILRAPSAEFEYLFAPHSADNRWSLGISQGFDWPGIYRTRRRIIKMQTVADDLRRREALINMHLEVSYGLIDMVGAKRRLELLEKMVSSLEQLQTAYQKAYAQGEATILDVNKIAIQLARQRAQLRQAQLDVVKARTDLQKIVPDIPLPDDAENLDQYPPEQIYTLEHYQMLLDRCPETLSGDAMVNLNKEKRHLDRLQSLFPGFSVGYSHAFEDDTHFNGFTVGVDLPIYTAKHRGHKTRYLNEAADIDANYGGAVAQLRMESDFRRANELKAQLAELGPVVENTNNLALLRRALEGGEMSLLNYLQEVNYFFEAQLDYENLRQEFATTLVSLNRDINDPIWDL